MMVELGERLYYAAGSDKNIKLTTKDDLEMFKVVNQSFTFKTSPKDIQQQTRYTVSSVKVAIDILNKE